MARPSPPSWAAPTARPARPSTITRVGRSPGVASDQAAATWPAWARARTYSSSSSSPAAAVPAATAAAPHPGAAWVATRATGPAIMARSASRSAVESHTNPKALVRLCMHRHRPVDRVGDPGHQRQRPRRRRPPRPEGRRPPGDQRHPQRRQRDQVRVHPRPGQRRPHGIGQPQVPRRQPPPRLRPLPEQVHLPPPRRIRLEGPAIPPAASCGPPGGPGVGGVAGREGGAGVRERAVQARMATPPTPSPIPTQPVQSTARPVRPSSDPALEQSRSPSTVRTAPIPVVGSPGGGA